MPFHMAATLALAIAVAGACTLAGKGPPKPGPPAIARHHQPPR